MPWRRLAILRPRQPGQGVAQTRRRGRDLNTGGLHGRNLAFGVSPATGDDGAGMAHAPAGRRGATGNESDYRLLAPTFGFVGDELSGVFLGRATDLTNHDDRLGRFVGQEHRQDVDELGALDGVAADSDGGRLTEPFAGRLINRLIGERARARHDTDFARAENIAWQDRKSTR